MWAIKALFFNEIETEFYWKDCVKADYVYMCLHMEKSIAL